MPDFLLIDEQGPVVVDVKPLARLSNPKVYFTLDWTRKLVESRGWRYEVWSEPPATELGNIRFLAGFRNPRCFDDKLVESIRQHELVGRTLGEALSIDFGKTPALVRSAVFHVIWNQYLSVDVSEPLTRLTILLKGDQKMRSAKGIRTCAGCASCGSARSPCHRATTIAVLNPKPSSRFGPFEERCLHRHTRGAGSL